MNYTSATRQLFNTFNYLFLAVLSALCLLPLLHILAVSFSGKAPAEANLIGLWPIDFTLDAYAATINNQLFLDSLWMAVVRTMLGTTLCMALVFLCAYPLSKDKGFKGRSAYAWFFVFTMLFSGGLVPSYIVMQKLGLMNSIWALVLPSAVNVWLIVLMLNFFRNVPHELEEASLIDGAGHFRTMVSVHLPLSMPSIATLSLFSMVFHWNEWFTGLLYLTESSKYPLATFLQTVIVQQDLTRVTRNPEALANIAQRSVKAAQICIGAFPILIVYPFMQKYFITGIVVGAVKE
ncbi:carbohydrate ABC transporter permease [Paenibacillus sp. CF384]|uniref:carbohydrate ABC transporter permease n=1 Tax=Paenibacillus sp. CF384 TaxID=1884382 RepID=UPI00089A24FB|nr:carbohydrate ABC transporter permease [Paenibacillus sp. CF384]SDX93222.1 putative aldouronate transport system permease protein [Paenibacillus sp. CF384]